MTGMIAAATFVGRAAPLAVIILWAVSAHAAQVGTSEAACALAEARMAAHLHRSQSRIADCETISQDESPQGFYVLALRGRCRETICGSTLIGWFAVQKRTGRVFQWDVAEWRLGHPIG